MKAVGGGGFWRLEKRLGLVLGYGNTFWVESGQCGGGGTPPPFKRFPAPVSSPPRGGGAGEGGPAVRARAASLPDCPAHTGAAHLRVRTPGTAYGGSPSDNRYAGLLGCAFSSASPNVALHVSSKKNAPESVPGQGPSHGPHTPGETTEVQRSMRPCSPGPQRKAPPPIPYHTPQPPKPPPTGTPIKSEQATV